MGIKAEQQKFRPHLLWKSCILYVQYIHTILYVGRFPIYSYFHCPLHHCYLVFAILYSTYLRWQNSIGNFIGLWENHKIAGEIMFTATPSLWTEETLQEEFDQIRAHLCTPFQKSIKLTSQMRKLQTADYILQTTYSGQTIAVHN